MSSPATEDVSLGGGADVIRQGLAAGVVDELAISTAPVVLGGGKRLFEGFEQDLDLEVLGVVELAVRHPREVRPSSGGPRRLPPRRDRERTLQERAAMVYACAPVQMWCGRSRGDLPREREVGDAAGGGDRLDVVGVLEGLQAVPDADAAAEHDRDLDEVHVVDEPGGDEVAHDGGAAADPDVLAVGCFAGGLERLGRGGVEEVERGAALHLDRAAAGGG